ncbi:MAG: hypothetical protein R2709_00995 [Marmoricola sp.]
MAADPPVLLTDEPFGAVDPLVRVHLQDFFLDLQKTLHKTVVMVTHDIDEAVKMAIASPSSTLTASWRICQASHSPCAAKR